MYLRFKTLKHPKLPSVKFSKCWGVMQISVLSNMRTKQQKFFSDCPKIHCFFCMENSNYNFCMIALEKTLVFPLKSSPTV